MISLLLRAIEYGIVHIDACHAATIDLVAANNLMAAQVLQLNDRDLDATRRLLTGCTIPLSDAIARAWELDRPTPSYLTTGPHNPMGHAG